MDGRYPAIEELVPHRAPMLLLDRVEDDGDRTTTCGLTIREDSSFVENGAVPSYLALEYMAQAVAAHAGLRDVRKGQPVSIGYLIGARNVEFLVDEFRVGDQLRIIVSHVWCDGELGQFEVRIESGNRRVAGAQLNVYQGNIEAAS
jgi:predicted hotdog family 3-hydroxylacyl-ACP dehydratase